MQARADENAFSGPVASGVPTRIAEQNRRILMRVGDGPPLAPPAAAVDPPYFTRRHPDSLTVRPVWPLERSYTLCISWMLSK